jgi:hypothetical protein
VNWVVVVAGAAITLVAIVGFLVARNDPESSASHADGLATASGSGHVGDRPAGPDAEPMTSEPDPRPSPPAD